MVTKPSSKKQLLSTIMLKASYPLERLKQSYLSKNNSDNQSGHDRLQHLYTVVNAISEEEKIHFLSSLQVDEEQLIQALSLPVSSGQITGSSWITKLDHILSEYTTGPSYEHVTHDRSLSSTAPFPFEELFLPFIHYARKQLMDLVPDQNSLLSDSVQATLETWLLSQLVYLAAPALAPEFTFFCALEDPLSHLPEQKGQQRILYERFLNRYSGEGLLVFFAEYSLLARLTIQYIETWIETCAEFIERLKTDLDQITHTFFEGQSPGLVVEIKTGCSDRHHHGRTVLLLTFANGGKLAYKPHNMDIDDAFFKFLEWLKKNNLSLDLKSPQVLKRNDHGWMEYIEHTPCTTSTEVEHYYQRCGLLVCLFYVLGSTDLHYENLIAHGAYPVPIDLETILSPYFSDFLAPGSAEEKMAKYSVLSSGMLKMKAKLEGQEINVAALGDDRTYISPLPMQEWKNINTDAMTVSYEIRRIDAPNTNKVLVDGRIKKSSAYVEHLVMGFRLMYLFFMEHRDELLDGGKMLDFFAECPIRALHRPTSVYAKQSLRLAGLQFLRDGAERWIDSQIFKKPLLKGLSDPLRWAIVAAELVAMDRLDVPRFVTTTSSNDLVTDDGSIIENVFIHSALEQTQSHLASLSDEDMEEQIRLIYEEYAL
jgi:type 2 lantibiotic biosynthesis protein LanM